MSLHVSNRLMLTAVAGAWNNTRAPTPRNNPATPSFLQHSKWLARERHLVNKSSRRTRLAKISRGIHCGSCTPTVLPEQSYRVAPGRRQHVKGSRWQQAHCTLPHLQTELDDIQRVGQERRYTTGGSPTVAIPDATVSTVHPAQEQRPHTNAWPTSARRVQTRSLRGPSCHTP